jgi:hypothetical protein
MNTFAISDFAFLGEASKETKGNNGKCKHDVGLTFTNNC